MDLYSEIHSVVFSERFWFGYNTSWRDMIDRTEGPWSHVHHPRPDQLWLSVPAAVLLLVVRHLYETLVMVPFARSCGITSRKATRQPETNAKLTKFFKTNRRPNCTQIELLSSELNWSVKRVQNWFRLKRNFRKSSTMKKFCESGWRCTFYIAMIILGIFVLHDEKFTYDWSLTRDVSDWPHHHIKTEYLVYYTVETAFYLSLLASMLTDVRRSDFIEFFLHHIVTVILLVFSWTGNWVRIGMLVLILHDLSDPWLEAMKMAHYCKSEKVTATFLIFLTVSWISTRIFLFPMFLVLPFWIKYMDWYPVYGHWYCGLSLLIFLTVLSVLSLFWTYFLIKAIYDVLSQSFDEVRDCRSESELSAESEHEYQNGHAKHD